MKPLLDAKGSPQSLGILDSPQDFWGFVYDVFIGIHRHPKPETLVAEALEVAPLRSDVHDDVVVPMIQKSRDDRKAS
jgi:hypothetical protein